MTAWILKRKVNKLPKVTIMQEGMSKRAYIDGKEVSNSIIGIDVGIRPDEIPTVDFEMMFADGFLELCDSDVRIKAHPETLQEAACIVRDELLKKGDLYDGFVASILSVLKPKEHYVSDGESEISAEYGANYLAEDILNRIVGLEEHDGSV
ncbi:hypothetical protein BN3589_03516 [Clostridium sp. C105KSO14]|nr:hypothetical protein BN3589_03516 [Clostridium sp. C105KSO14]